MNKMNGIHLNEKFTTDTQNEKNTDNINNNNNLKMASSLANSSFHINKGNNGNINKDNNELSNIINNHSIYKQKIPFDEVDYYTIRRVPSALQHVIQAPIVCPPGYAPDRNGKCRPIFY